MYCIDVLFTFLCTCVSAPEHLITFQVLATEGLGCCKVALTGSASIHQNVMEFFEAIGLPLVDGMGMTT